MATVFPCPPLDELRAQAQPLIDELRAALRLPAELDAALVGGLAAPPANLLRLAYVAPASEAHHDAGPLGLVRHSLRVAARAAQLHRAHAAEPPTGTPEHLAWRRTLVAVTLAGLLHDVGKLWFLDIAAGGRHWPVHRYLADFAREAGARTLTIAHRPGRTRGGPGGHEPLSAIYLGMVVPLGCLPWLGGEATNTLVATLTATLAADPAAAAYRLVKDADVACTAEAVAGARETAAPAAPTHVAGSGAIGDDLVHGLRALSDDPRLRWNLVDGHVLLSPTHSVLFISMNGQANVFRLVFEAVRAQVLQAGAGGYVRAFYAAGDPHRWLDEIAVRVLPSGAPWCVPASAATPPDQHAIRHYVVATGAAGRRRRAGYAVILRNEALWGTHPIAAKGCFVGALVLCSDDRRTPSADPEDLGFRAPADAPRAVRPVSLVQAVAGGAAEHVLDLAGVATALVREIDALVPSVDHAESDRRWRALTAEPVVPEPLVLPALEAVLDRLRQLRARGVAAVASAQPDQRGVAHATEVAADSRSALANAAAVVCDVVAAARGSATTDATDAGFHAVRSADGSLFLPWPQCLDGLIDPRDQVRCSGAADAHAVADALALPPPAPARIAGFRYGPGRRHHRGLRVPAGWRPDLQGPASAVVRVAAGVIDEVLADT